MLRDEFMEVLEDRETSLRTVDLKKVEVIPPQDFTGHRRLRINDEIFAEGNTFDLICRDLFKAPAGFLRRAPIDLSNTIVQRMFKESDVAEKKQLVLNKDKILTAKPKEAVNQSALPVFEKVFEELPEIKTVTYRDYGMFFDVDVVSESIELQPKLRDITNGGIRCRYSEFMFKRPTVEPYTERLGCLNGMTFPEYFNVLSFDDVESFLANVGKAVRDAKEVLNTKINDQLKKATEMKVNGEQAIRRIFKQNRISPTLLNEALAAHVVEGDGTAYGVLQAITRTANGSNLTDRTRYRLQELGGRELEVVSAAHCPECYASL